MAEMPFLYGILISTRSASLQEVLYTIRTITFKDFLYLHYRTIQHQFMTLTINIFIFKAYNLLNFKFNYINSFLNMTFDTNMVVSIKSSTIVLLSKPIANFLGYIQ